jgi:phage terminase Nu1 subunit (DNA packaging protein)
MKPEQHVSTVTVAKYLSVTPARVRQLVVEGVLKRAVDRSGKPLRGRFVLLAAVNGYIGYLRSRLASGSDGNDYTVARAKRMAAQAEIESLRLRRVRGELHHARDVEFVMTSMLTALKSRLLALPSRCAPYLTNKTNTGEVAETIRIKVYDVLRELSDYDPAVFEAANEEYLRSLGAAKPESNGENP